MINWIMVVVFTMFGLLFGQLAVETGSDLARWVAGLNIALVILNLVVIASRRRRAPRVEVSVLPPEDPYSRLYERRRRQRGQGGDGSTG